MVYTTYIVFIVHAGDSTNLSNEPNILPQHLQNEIQSFCTFIIHHIFKVLNNIPVFNLNDLDTQK